MSSNNQMVGNNPQQVSYLVLASWQAVKPDPLVCPKRTMTNTSRSTSATEGHTSLDMNLSDELARRGSWLLGPLSSAPMPLSAPATPPPELEEETDNQTMTGIGCLFPQMLLSRPSSLAVGSENNTDAPSTPSQMSDVNDDNDQGANFPSENLLETPRAISVFQTPTLALSTQPVNFGQMPPLTPDSTPIRTILKRAPSPPCAPRLKKARHTVDVESEDEGYSEMQSREPSTGQSLQNIQQLTIDLAGSTGIATSPSNNAASETETNTQAELQPESYRPDQAISEHYSANPTFSLAIEWFAEDEILEQLSVLLGAYRAFHLGPDEAEGPMARDPEAAQIAQETFEAIFQNKLNSDNNKEFLLQEEEEDVLNVFATWIREMKTSSDESREAFEDVTSCIQRVTDLTAAPFIRRLVLFGEPIDIDLVVDDLTVSVMPAYQDHSTIEWEFEMFFRDFEQLSID
ncbi:hypothetical protein QBC36DRAFT_319442 [Triangularia setosa]|uniref:Uncharacterized protein n=1 Tax=Triangularia setosa TaxID=2587417 RepID=A0AAN6WEX9_9PEZI|nr:hypothetical protein QBC36DRAFT_319442 [Podospora setosa]